MLGAIAKGKHPFGAVSAMPATKLWPPRNFNPFIACEFTDLARISALFGCRAHAAQAVPPKERFGDFVEHTMTFLVSPWIIDENGGIALRRTVPKVAFAEPLSYTHESGYRTAKTGFLFRGLTGISTQICEMVEPRGVEPLTSCMPCKRSPN